MAQSEPLRLCETGGVPYERESLSRPHSGAAPCAEPSLTNHAPSLSPRRETTSERGVPAVGGPFGLPGAQLPCPHPKGVLPTGLPKEPSTLLAVPVRLVHLLVPVRTCAPDLWSFHGLTDPAGNVINPRAIRSRPHRRRVPIPSRWGRPTGRSEWYYRPAGSTSTPHPAPAR